MRKKEKHYVVEFPVYHYNSGKGDNGTFTSSIRCESLKEAIKTKKKVDLVYNTDDLNDLSEEIQKWFYDEVMSDTAAGGFIRSEAKVISKYIVEIELDII